MLPGMAASIAERPRTAQPARLGEIDAFLQGAGLHQARIARPASGNALANRLSPSGASRAERVSAAVLPGMLRMVGRVTAKVVMKLRACAAPGQRTTSTGIVL